MSSSTRTRLTRSAAGARPPAPVRIVHLGLGSFFRAHQAWYTDRAPDAVEWGIAAFTGRNPWQAQALAPQEGLYTLVTRTPQGDDHEFVASLSAVHDSSEYAAFLGRMASPAVSVVTLTVTEAGYCRRADGGLDGEAAEVAADVAALADSLTAPVSTVPGRLVAGLAARREAGAGGLAVMPCDNLAENGSMARRVVLELAGGLDAGLTAWIEEHVTFVTSMVDRITPRTTDEDRSAVLAATGFEDASPVVTEPVAEWVVSGEFPAGRPRWEDTGVTFVDDVTPFETRKLLMLNGAHSLLAYAGSIRGHTTVAEAIADRACRAWVDQWWDEASRHVPLPAGSITVYRSALLDRFGNAAIRHLLGQIAADGSQKLPMRVAPVLRAERAAGRVPVGAVRVLGAWLMHLRGEGAPVSDTGLGTLRSDVQTDAASAARHVVAAVAPELTDDSELVSAVVDAAHELTGERAAGH